MQDGVGMMGANEEATCLEQQAGPLQTSRDLVFTWVKRERYWRDLGVGTRPPGCCVDRRLSGLRAAAGRAVRSPLVYCRGPWQGLEDGTNSICSQIAHGP